MVDGDACRRIVTPRAMEFMLRTDAADRYLASDNYDVNHSAFDAVKKTLIRISRLVSFPADANLWMPIPGHPDKIRVVIRNANELSQFWPWGALYQDDDSGDGDRPCDGPAHHRRAEARVGIGSGAGVRQPGRHRSRGRGREPETTRSA